MSKPDFSHETLYQGLMARDSAFNDHAVICVTSTGIYCRFGCPARTPLRKNVRFLADIGAARAAGFRACKRCKPDG